MYVCVSLAGRNTYILDRLLHRRQYADAGVQSPPQRGVRDWRAIFGISNEFMKVDKDACFGVIPWSYGWVVVNLENIAVNLVQVRSDDYWIQYFKRQLYLFLGAIAIAVIWFRCDAMHNAVELCKGQAAASRDAVDGGWVDHNGESQEK